MDEIIDVENLELSKKTTRQNRTLIGNGFDENVNFYLDEIGKYPLLTKEEEQLLAREVKRGNELAGKHFIECNLRLVVKIAKRYFCKDLSLLDLIEEGNLGLMIAVDKYDGKCDTKFSAYAAFWIEEAIMRSIANKGKMIRIPVNIYGKVVTYRKAVKELEFKLLRQPTIEEVASSMKISSSEVRMIRDIQRETLSINELLGTDDKEDRNREDFLASNVDNPEEIVEIKNLSSDVNKLLETNLSKREIEILSLRFGLNEIDPLSYEAIGKMYGISRERAHKIVANSLDKIKKSLSIKEFAVYIDNPSGAIKVIDEYQEECERKRILAKEQRRLARM